MKYDLYRQALKQVFDAVQADNKKTGRNIKCYVATHSLINYAHWGIVSPESSLMQVRRERLHRPGLDGHGARPTSMRACSGAHLRDCLPRIRRHGGLDPRQRRTALVPARPSEDNPGHSWDDYRTNWECTVAASLLWPEVFRYEVAPWPERVMHGKYPTVDSKQRKFFERVIREPNPSAYASELLTVMNALNDMDQCRPRLAGIVEPGKSAWPSPTR